jgi:hypothetical protein
MSMCRKKPSNRRDEIHVIRRRERDRLPVLGVYEGRVRLGERDTRNSVSS